MIRDRWLNKPCVVVASGPSLTQEAAQQCEEAHVRGTHGVIAVSDAYRLLPSADILYSADILWWRVHRGCPEFKGEKWIARQAGTPKWDEFGLRNILVRHLSGLSMSEKELYGYTSGFQAFNMAVLTGSDPIILTGYDMRVVGGRRHFFGDHPAPLDNSSPYECWVSNFDAAAKVLSSRVRVVNTTLDSAIRCFEMLPLAEALRI